MKQRPALDPTTGTDGVGAFNDNSEQFVGGDFAEDIGEDFFGFKELGLDKEFGLDTLSVPFHLLQNRMHLHHSMQNNTATTLTGDIMKEPDIFDPVTAELLKTEVGLVQDFFMAKIHKGNEEKLVEDDDLPPKQRFPKPRLPPTGKITSPRKRPIKEQQQMAKKKRKLEEGREEVIAHDQSVGQLGKPVGKLKLDPPANRPTGDPEKEDDAPASMMSPPESL
jgi:transcriptional activator SPT7